MNYEDIPSELKEKLRELLRAGSPLIRFSAPPVQTFNWDEESWLKYLATEENLEVCRQQLLTKPEA